MKREFILRRLSRLMGWDEERDLKEFPWLRMMSALKFDSYQDFLAGARFIECLVDWLQQFPTDEDRATAYDFVRNKLLFISAAEMQHLVELFYLEEIERRLLSIVAARLSISTYQVWSHPDGRSRFRTILRKTLFIGLSDGARIDAFRRANAGIISNEQVVVYPRINAPKWRELLKDLREGQSPDAKFEVVYLIDDFTASGTSLLRKPPPSTVWKGKIAKFIDDIKGRLEDSAESPSIRQGCLSADAVIVAHHYLATKKAKEKNDISIDRFRSEVISGMDDPIEIDLSYGHLFHSDFALDGPAHGGFLALADRHYNPSIEEQKHNAESGVSAINRGYAECALPLVLEHNTPNNSFAMIWAECHGGTDAIEMRPLFRRRQRHTDELEDSH
jgi:hypothetical protein